jgi:CBS domain-containing membrane protein
MPDRDAFPQEHGTSDHISSFFRKLRLDWLLLHFPPRLVRAVYVFVNGFLTIGLLALLALVSRNPLSFRRWGRRHISCSLHLWAEPQARAIPSSAMRSASSAGMGLSLPPAPEPIPFGEHPGIFWPRVLAAALSLSATGAFMVLLDASHPPAGATTLIVSLGIISKPRELAVIEAAVFLLVAQALVIDRLAGLPYPVWSAPAQFDIE